MSAIFLCLYEYSPVRAEILRQADRSPKEFYQVSINEIQKARGFATRQFFIPSKNYTTYRFPITDMALTSDSL
jgi:hypothetical protein